MQTIHAQFWQGSVKKSYVCHSLDELMKVFQEWYAVPPMHVWRDLKDTLARGERFDGWSWFTITPHDH